MSSNYDTGAAGERYVAQFLEAKGYEILVRNYRIRGGEIDIIARKGGTLAFVEVKTRKKGALTSGEEAITSSKKSFIIRAAERFLSEYDDEVDGRFDVAAVDMDTENERVIGLRYYPAAFDASK